MLLSFFSTENLDGVGFELFIHELASANVYLESEIYNITIFIKSNKFILLCQLH